MGSVFLGEGSRQWQHQQFIFWFIGLLFIQWVAQSWRRSQSQEHWHQQVRQKYNVKQLFLSDLFEINWFTGEKLVGSVPNTCSFNHNHLINTFENKGVDSLKLHWLTLKVGIDRYRFFKKINDTDYLPVYVPDITDMQNDIYLLFYFGFVSQW